jgi:hypothetical protein
MTLTSEFSKQKSNLSICIDVSPFCSLPLSLYICSSTGYKQNSLKV